MDDFSDNEEQNEILHDVGKRCTVFVLDYGEHVFVAGEEYFCYALQLVRSRINYLCCKGGLNEMAAVIFVNTPNKETENINCVFTHRPVGYLDVDYVKELDLLIKNKFIRKKLSLIFGENYGNCNWEEVLNLCQKFFNYNENIFFRQEIQIFTTRHNPFSKKKINLEIIESYVNDLKLKKTQLNVCLTDIALKCNEMIENDNIKKKLDLNLVSYKDIDALWKTIDFNYLKTSTESVLHRFVHKDVSIQPITTIPLKFGNYLEIAIEVYSLIKEQTKPANVLLDSETNNVLECRTRFVFNESSVTNENENIVNNEIYTGKVNYMHEIGGVNIILNKLELENFRRIDSPGITIIGFKPLNLLKKSYQMGFSKFIWPNNNIIFNSGTLYKALYKNCLDRKLFILIRYTEKINTYPQLAALIPQKKNSLTKDIVNEYFYEGFYLIKLPYSEDKRNLTSKKTLLNETWILLSSTQEEIMKNLIKKLTFDYNPYQFSNPTLQNFYSGLEAIALKLDIAENVKEEKVNNKFNKLHPYYENLTLKSCVEDQLRYLKETFSGENLDQTKKSAFLTRNNKRKLT